jgi:hypothetical protein
VSPMRIGVLAAIAVAGPPLWFAVGHGDLTSWGAVSRGVVVAMACTIGAAVVMRLLRGYDGELREAERDYLREALLERRRLEAARVENQREVERRQQEAAKREEAKLRREREAELAARQAEQKATPQKSG